MNSVITCSNNEILFSNHTKIIVVYTGDKIDHFHFRGNPKICELVLPDLLTIIGREAFKNCKNLQKFKIPQNVYEIGSGCFEDCEKLECVKFEPNSKLRIISARLFRNCKELTTVELPSEIETLGYNCFQNCTRLTEIKLPTNLETIGASCFENCKRLSILKFTEFVKVINSNAFYKCSNLKEIFIPSNISSIGSYTFCSCSKLEKIIFQSTEIHIDWTTFTNSEKLKAEITLKTQNNVIYNIFHFPICETINIIPGFYQINQNTLSNIYNLSNQDTKIQWTSDEFNFRTLGGDKISVNLGDNTKEILDSSLDVMEEFVIVCAKKLEVRPEEIFIAEREIIVYHFTIDVVVHTKFCDRDDNVSSAEVTLLAEKGFCAENKEEVTVFDALDQISTLLNIEIDPYSTVILINDKPVEGNDLSLSEANIKDNSIITLL